jgi:hypothetical protein
MGSGELGGSGTVVSIIGGDGSCSVTMVEGIMGLDSGSSIIWIILWVSSSGCSGEVAQSI